MKEIETINRTHVERLTKAMCQWFVRRENRFYAVGALDKKLSREDVQRSSLLRLKDLFPDVPITSDLVREVFKLAITSMHFEPELMIPTWNGSTLCQAGEDAKFIWKDGMVSVNTWRKPDYRGLTINDRELHDFEAFMECLFPKPAEKARVMDWVGWCLRNESEKPLWALMLYSPTKGTGKSTFCSMLARLFGEHNTAVQNSVDKLTSRFNVTPLMHKLVICEEVSLRPDSVQGNTLKTYITEQDTLAERKGQEAATIRQSCCFVLTSNHFPSWVEAEDRRYWIAEISHDGHAAGPKTEEFASLIASLKENLEDPAYVASLYRYLIERDLSEGFSAKTLNVVGDATDVMRRVHSSSEQVSKTRLQEHLLDLGAPIIPEGALAEYVSRELNLSSSSLRHSMPDLRWTKKKIKWGDKDFVRAVWIKEDHNVDRGWVYGPDDSKVKLSEYEGFGACRISNPDPKELPVPAAGDLY